MTLKKNYVAAIPKIGLNSIICSKNIIVLTLFLFRFVFQEKGNPSRLAKISFFKRWLSLVRSGQLTPISDNLYTKQLAESSNNPCNPGVAKMIDIDMTLYCQAKKAACNFQSAKDQLFIAFKKAELGTWVKKPIEQDDFEVMD